MPLVEILLSWAVTLSGYPAPAEVPEIVPVDHAFMVEHACGGDSKCKALGWYSQGTVLYIDARLRPDQDTAAASIVVHEMVHYLQGQSGAFGHDCESTIRAEREAYGVQREFLLAYGVYFPVGLGFIRTGC